MLLFATNAGKTVYLMMHLLIVVSKFLFLVNWYPINIDIKCYRIVLPKFFNLAWNKARFKKTSLQTADKAGIVEAN